MRIGMQRFLFWVVLWNAGAGALFCCGLVGATNISFTLGKPWQGLVWWLCGLSLTGICGVYLHLDLAEQISWTHADFNLLGWCNESWATAGIFALVVAGITCFSRMAETPPPPFAYTLWMAGASILLLTPSHFLALWCMENIDEIHRELPLTRSR